MTDTLLVFMTGTLLSFPVLYWILQKLMGMQGRISAPGPKSEAGISDDSDFQRLLVRESLDRVLRLVDELQHDGTAPTPNRRFAGEQRPESELSDDQKRRLAECTDLVNALLSEEDARQIRVALFRLEAKTTHEEFLTSLGNARDAAFDLRQSLAEGAKEGAPTKNRKPVGAVSAMA